MNEKTSTEFINLGRIGYQEAWDFQEKLFDQNLKAKSAGLPTRNSLIFCEHEHVYTLGKSGSKNNLLANNKQLQELGVTFFKTNRGGDITYHGPGQIVGYPILDLENFGLGVKTYVDNLEESIIVALTHFGINGERLPGATGVWLDVNVPGKTRKICAIGVKASRHITMHGFAFNVNTDLNFFNLINPCGFTDKAVTSLQKELGAKQDFARVQKIVKMSLAEVFGFSKMVD
ncbi:MAG: lipoyl(octanoyl) transferase LipB [Bacteroidales bacterium]|nr:lipoyl(octanoyl) transferase LipB [Bacteroidales bacterium]